MSDYILLCHISYRVSVSYQTASFASKIFRNLICCTLICRRRPVAANDEVAFPRPDAASISFYSPCSRRDSLAIPTLFPLHVPLSPVPLFFSLCPSHSLSRYSFFNFARLTHAKWHLMPSAVCVSEFICNCVRLCACGCVCVCA